MKSGSFVSYIIEFLNVIFIRVNGIYSLWISSRLQGKSNHHSKLVLINLTFICVLYDKRLYCGMKKCILYFWRLKRVKRIIKWLKPTSILYKSKHFLKNLLKRIIFNAAWTSWKYSLKNLIDFQSSVSFELTIKST